MLYGFHPLQLHHTIWVLIEGVVNFLLFSHQAMRKTNAMREKK